MSNTQIKKYVLKCLPLLLVFWLSFYTLSSFGMQGKRWLVSGCITVAAFFYVQAKRKSAAKYRVDYEYGSARWGTAEDIKPFIDPNPRNNIILTQTESLSMNSRMQNWEYNRNKNVLVIGGSGTGKTRFYLKPNLMQMHSSYVVTDPKGSIITECGKMLADNGYKIKCLNLYDFAESMHYNPFEYIRSEKDILKFANTLIINTKGEGEKATEDFWVKAERLLYCALIGYIWYEAPEEEKTIVTMIEMLDAMAVREEDEGFKNIVDLMFEALEEKDSSHFAVRQYRKYKLAAGKTAKSILISCAARLSPFDIKEVRDLMEYDELELDLLGDRKTAFFVVISDTDSTFNFLAAIMYTQMFNILCDRADKVYKDRGSRLPIHVRCLLDEFANIGQIPKFKELISTIRSREISATIILQAKSQLRDIYGDKAAETIEGNCDTVLFLGGKEKTTIKDMADALGKETIHMHTSGRTRGMHESFNQNDQKLGKELMTQDELKIMDGGKCIMELRGVRPFLSQKYDITKHKNYALLSDANPRNAFYMSTHLSKPIQLDEANQIEVFEVEI